MLLHRFTSDPRFNKPDDTTNRHTKPNPYPGIIPIPDPILYSYGPTQPYTNTRCTDQYTFIDSDDFFDLDTDPNTELHTNPPSNSNLYSHKYADTTIGDAQHHAHTTHRHTFFTGGHGNPNRDTLSIPTTLTHKSSM